MPGEGNDPEEETMSEVAERAMEANIKILVGNEISHAKRVDVIAEQSLSDAVNLARKTNDAYLMQMEMLHKHFLDNDRFTLDRLYGMFPEEAAGTATLVSLVVEALKVSGWQAPSPSP